MFFSDDGSLETLDRLPFYIGNAPTFYIRTLPYNWPNFVFWCRLALDDLLTNVYGIRHMSLVMGKMKKKIW